MGLAHIYPSFARGEISPHMFGRIDIEQYNSCLKKARNVWIRPYGEVARVSGSEFVNGVKNNGYVKLLKFVFSAIDSYIIECGVGYFRFYRNGALILKNGQPYEVANTFTLKQLDTIQYIQIDDVMKIVCEPDGANSTNRPKELLRLSSDNWVFRDVAFQSTPYLELNTTNITLLPSATTGNITLTASSGIFQSSHIGSFWRIGTVVEKDGIKKQGFVKITGFASITSVNATVQWQLSGTTATVNWAEGEWSDLRGYPTKIGLFEGRLCYARTPFRKRNVYASKTYSYENFSYAVDNEDDGALNLELSSNASGDGSDIKWVVGGNNLYVGTYGGEFVIKASGDSAITPTNVSARQRSNLGSEAIVPVMIGSYVNFIQRNGTKLRQFIYDYITETYKSQDMSLFSENLLDSPIIDLAYVKSPDSILYMLRKDGKVVMFTFDSEQQIQAFSLLEFDGLVESIGSIPSMQGEFDEMWFSIKRTINGQPVRYIERMCDLITPDIQQKCFYVRSGLTYDGYALTVGNDLTITGNNITCSQSFFNPSMVGRKIRYFDTELKAECVITEFVDDRNVNVQMLKPFEVSSVLGGKWAISVVTLSNLNHLENEKVQILADGSVQTDRVVNGGSITLEAPCFFARVGLQYQSYIETMPIIVGSENGTAVGKRKRVNELAMRVWNTLGLRVGDTLERLIDVQFRTPRDNFNEPQKMFTGVIPNIKFNQSWTWESTIVVEQSKPLPMNILSLAPMVNLNDK